MADRSFPGGAWPVMLTPFTEDDQVDVKGLEALTNWYIENGCGGLFADCQSSEMFYLSQAERVEVARTVIRAAAGRVPVIVSGHISERLDDQIEEMQALAATGPDALIFITNRFEVEGQHDEGLFKTQCKFLMGKLPDDLPLGVYECPYPYKRLLSDDLISWLASTGRFHFIKDTCCDLATIKRRLELIKGSPLRLYNANTSTLLDSLRAGAHGFCGVMASFQMRLYAYLCAHLDSDKADRLQHLLTVTSLIERQCYPVNAKYYLREFEGLPITIASRTRDPRQLTETFKAEVLHLKRLTDEVAGSLGL